MDMNPFRPTSIIMGTPIVITKVTRYCLFKKTETGGLDGETYHVRVWVEDSFGRSTTGYWWLMGHLAKDGLVATTGPSFNDVNPSFAEKLENEYQTWLKNKK